MLKIGIKNYKGVIVEPEWCGNAFTDISFLSNGYSESCKHVVLPKWLSSLIEAEVRRSYLKGREDKGAEIRKALGLK